jgi:anti-sigma factor RsiW
MNGDSHPDLLALDAHRVGELVDSDLAEHLAACRECESELALQQALAAELGAPIAIEIPAPQDASLRAAARQRAEVVRSRRRWPWIAAAGLAVAAAAALLLILGRGGDGRGSQVAAAPIQGDVNLDGRLDVIDALVLARQLDGGGADVTRADVNRDGRVDQSDVEWISASIVSLRSAQ